MATIPELTEAELQHEIQNGRLPLLVYFVSAHCVPCKTLTPVVELLQSEWDGEVRVVKFDVLAHMRATLRYGVMSAPELILFKNRKQAARVHGNAPKVKLKQIFEPHLK